MNAAERAYFELGFAYGNYIDLKNFSIALNERKSFDLVEYMKGLIGTELNEAVRYMAIKHKEAMLHSDEVDNTIKTELRKFGKKLYKIADIYRVNHEQECELESTKNLMVLHENTDQFITKIIDETTDEQVKQFNVESGVLNECRSLFESLKKKGIIRDLKKEDNVKNVSKKFDLTIANAYSFELKNNDLSRFSKEELNTPFLRIEILNDKIWDLLPLLTDKNRYGSTLAQLAIIDRTNYVVDVLNFEIYNKLFSEEEWTIMELCYNILCDDNEFMFQVESGVDENHYIRWFIK